jgi:hypothetical protein
VQYVEVRIVKGRGGCRTSVSSRHLEKNLLAGLQLPQDGLQLHFAVFCQHEVQSNSKIAAHFF